MRREDIKKSSSKKGSKMLASESDIIQKSPGNYSTRYKGELAPEKEIVAKQYTPTYKSRYK